MGNAVVPVVSIAVRPINLILARFIPNLLGQVGTDLREQEIEILVSVRPEEWREAYEERAAMMEYDGGLAREDAENKAYLAMRDLQSMEPWPRNTTGHCEDAPCLQENNLDLAIG